MTREVAPIFSISSFFLWRGKGGSRKYVWQWNDRSVVRKDRSDDYVLDTYDHLIRQKIAITEDLIRRGMGEKVIGAVVKTVVDCYYDCQNPNWRLPKNKERLHKVQNWFAAYLKRYANYYTQADVRMISSVARICREQAMRELSPGRCAIYTLSPPSLRT